MTCNSDYCILHALLLLLCSVRASVCYDLLTPVLPHRQLWCSSYLHDSMQQHDSNMDTTGKLAQSSTRLHARLQRKDRFANRRLTLSEGHATSVVHSAAPQSSKHR